MARTITALFDTRADADAGAARLREAGIDAGNVRVHQDSDNATAAGHSTHADRGLWASIKHAFLPEEDRHTYEEGLRRGGFLLTADVDDDQTPIAVQALEQANSIDLDERSQGWRAQGWAPPAGTSYDGDLTDFYGERDADQGVRFRSYSAVRSFQDRDI